MKGWQVVQMRMMSVPTEKKTGTIHVSVSLLLFPTTNARHSLQNHTWLQNGWIEDWRTYLHQREDNPVASGVVEETTQLLARVIVDMDERRLGYVQYVMCRYVKCPDSMDRAVLYCSTNRRLYLTPVWQRRKAYKWQSARMATDVPFLGERQSRWWQEVPILTMTMTKAVTSLL